VPVGTADATGSLVVSHEVDAPSAGEDWWFVVVCAPGDSVCGTDQSYGAVTAPIWLAAE
jgi:hypothetical protein